MILGANKLELTNGLRLGAPGGPVDFPDEPGNILDFSLFTPGVSGTIKLTGGAFTGTSTANVQVNISPGAEALSGIYDLIDWTMASSFSGVELADFVLTVPTAYTGASLRFSDNGKILQLVAPVPDGGATLVFLGLAFACIGLFGHRRFVNV